MTRSLLLLTLFIALLAGACGTTRTAPGESARAIVASLPAAFVGRIDAGDGPAARFVLELRPVGAYLLRTVPGGARPRAMVDEAGRWRLASDSASLLLEKRPGESIAVAIVDSTTLYVPRGGADPVVDLGDTAGRVLRRTERTTPLAARLQIRGELVRAPGGARLRDCVSLLDLAVAPHRLLDSAYAASGPPGHTVVVHVLGRLEQRPRMEVAGFDEVFVVEQFNGILPFGSCAEIGGGEADLSGTNWRLETLGGEPITTSARPSQIDLTIDAAGTRASGLGGCNRFGAGVEIDGATIRFTGIVSTKMACDDLAIESRYVAALEAARRWRIEDTRLVLAADDGTELATFEKWEPRR